jgi:hypothetical protein
VQDSSAPTPSKVFGDLAREYLGANHSTKERAELYEKIVGSKDVSPNGWQTAIIGLEAMLIDRKEAVNAK